MTSEACPFITSKSNPSLTFLGEARAYTFEAPLWSASAFRANIRLGWKCLEVTNALAYDILFLCGHKKFHCKVHFPQYNKTFFYLRHVCSGLISQSVCHYSPVYFLHFGAQPRRGYTLLVVSKYGPQSLSHCVKRRQG